MLLYLAADYARSPELRQRFADNPGEVLGEYLSDDQRAALEGSGRYAVERVLHDGVDELIRTLEAHRELALLTDMSLWAAPPAPQPQKVSPAVVNAGQPVSLTVSGSNFYSPVAVWFQTPGTKAVPMAEPQVTGKGTQISGPVTFQEKGVYNCVVTNWPGQKGSSSGTLAQAITVT